MGIDGEKIMSTLPARSLFLGSCMIWLFSTMAAAQTIQAGADPQYNQKIAGNNEGYYDDTDYLSHRVFGAAAIGVIIALCSCICGICFCLIQSCAKCCECMKCFSCCGAGNPAPEGYTQNQRLALVAILFFGWAMIVAGSGLGYSGNAAVATGLDDLSDSCVQVANEMVEQVQMGYDAAKSVGDDPDEQMVTDATDLQKSITDAADFLTDTNDIRILSVYIFYAIMMVIPLLGFLAWWMGKSCPAYVMTQAGFCLLFAAWIFFALTFACGVILDDTCVNAGQHVYGQNNTLSSLLECGEADASASVYTDVWKTLDINEVSYDDNGYTPAYPIETSVGLSTTNGSDADALANSQKYDANRALLLEYYTAFEIEASTCASVADSEKTVLCYVPGMDATIYNDTCLEPSGGCTDSSLSDGTAWVDNVGDSCAQYVSSQWCAQYGDAYANDGLTANQACCGCGGGGQADSKPCLQQGLILSAAAMTGASYMLSCDYLDTLALDLNNNICDGMVKGLIDTCIGQAFIGFFYFFVVAVGCMGMNRFNADNYSDNPARVHPEQGPEGQNGSVPAATYQLQVVSVVSVETPGQYSAEQAMAATRIQSKQRQKQARRKVETQRSAKANQGGPLKPIPAKQIYQ